jgi:hypothetical protein
VIERVQLTLLWCLAALACAVAVRACVDIASPGPCAIGLSLVALAVPSLVSALWKSGLLLLRRSVNPFEVLGPLGARFLKRSSVRVRLALIVLFGFGVVVAAIGIATGDGHVRHVGAEYYSVNNGVRRPITKHSYDVANSAGAKLSGGVRLALYSVSLALVVAGRRNESVA